MPKETTPSVAEQADERAEEIEAVIACLGDDASALRDDNPEDERAANMDRAAELLAALAASQAASHSAPVESKACASVGVEPKRPDTEFLCQIWGEDIDHTLTAIVPDWEGVRRFCVEFWTGREDASDYDGSLTLDNLKAEFDEHEADGRGAYTQTWEIGGVSVERICNCSPAALASPAPVPAVTEGASRRELVDLLTSAAWQLKQHASDGNHVSSPELPGKLIAVASALAAPAAAVPESPADKKGGV